MNSIKESFKRLYADENAVMKHSILFIICFIYMLASSLFDIAIGKPNTARQNPFDFVFGVFIIAYSIQYIHNFFKDEFYIGIPSIKEINPKAYSGAIAISIVWGIYAVLFIVGVLLPTGIVTIATKGYLWLAIGALELFAIIILFSFVEFIYLAYAEKMSMKGLYNIALVFKFVKASFKPFMLNVLIFAALTFVLFLGYILIIAAATLLNFTETLPIVKDYYLFDALIYPLFMYAFSILWYFAFPFCLKNTFIEKIKPLLMEQE